MAHKIPTFNGDSRSYELWEVKFLGLMRLKKLSKVFSEDNPDPEDNAEAFAELIQCIDDRSLSLIMRDATDKGKEALDLLRRHYRPKGKSTIISLYQELTSLTLASESITDYIIRAETAANALRQTGETISDSLLIAMVIKGLPKSYQSFITVTTQRETPQSFIDFKESLRNQEQSIHNDENSVMVFNHQNQKSSGHLWCAHCKSRTHNTDLCYKKKPSNHINATGRRVGKLNKSTKRFCDYHQSDSHWTSQCRARPRNHCAKQANDVEVPNDTTNEHNFSFMIQDYENRSLCSFVNGTQPDSTQHQLLIDSGASTHIINDRKLFRSFDQNFNSDKHVIELANGLKTTKIVEGCGDAAITIRDSDNIPREIILKNALYIPSFKQNILSVSAATKYGALINFQNGSGTIEYNKVKFKLFKSRNLYFVNAVDSGVRSETLLSWHQILGHCNVEDIRKLANKGDIHILDPHSEIKCETCILGKMTNSRNRQPDAKAQASLQKVHLDLAGPIDPASKDGHKYCLVCVDDFSGLTCVYFLKSKSDTTAAFQRYLADISPYGHVKCVRTDGGGEFMSREFKNILTLNRIKHEQCSPYSPHQNGTSERQWRTLFEMARCLLIDSGLSKTLWTYAVMMSCFIRNRCYNNRLTKTPFQALTGKRPDYGKMQKFGSNCFALKQNPKKLDTRAEKGIFVGIDKESPAYLIYFPGNNSVRKIRCVKFQNIDSNDSNENEPNLELDLNCNDNDNELIFIDNHDAKSYPRQSSSLMTPPYDVSVEIPSSEDDENTGTDRPTEPESTETKPKRTHRRPKYLDDYCLENDNDNLCMITNYCYNANYDEVPKTYFDAITRNDKNEWNNAMVREINALVENDTYEVVPLPENRKIIKGRWVYAIKSDKNGNKTYKARYVAKGFTQEEGIDYSETFSPTTRMSSIRTLSQIAVQHDLEIHQMDVKAAYLNAPIDCELFVEQPLGFEEKDKDKYVLKLKKSLYGLKQSGRNWNNTLDQHLSKEGFIRSINEPCLYFNRVKNIFLLIWVDDIMIAAKSSDMRHIKGLLEDKFHMKDLGQIDYFLGIEFEIGKDTISMSQSNFISTILERFGMTNCKPRATPIEMKPLKGDETPLNANELTRYRQMVGALIYLMVATRPDLSYAVTKLSQYMSNALQLHMTMAKHVLRYLKGTIHEKLSFMKSNEPFSITGFCDSDWANSEDRKSVTGYAFKLSKNGSLISWKSKKQPTVALSSCEAEYMSLTSATQEGKYLCSLLNEILNCKLSPFTIFCDNQGAIALAKNPINHQRSKHIDIRYHFVRDEVVKKKLTILYVPSVDNIADIFTKALSKVKFETFKASLFG